MTGTLKSGTVAGLTADDSSYYVLSTVNGAAQWWASIKGMPSSVASLSVTYNGRAAAACTQNVSIWNWYLNSWVNISHTSATTASDSTVTIAPAGLLSDYLFLGELRASVQCFQTGAPTFNVSSDLLKISYS
jgi:hypothetical protein